MKILLITHFWHNNSHHSLSSGYERLALYLSKDNAVDVLTCGQKNEKIKLSDNLWLITRVVPPTNLVFEKRIALSFHSTRLNEKYDIVHSLYSDAALLTSYAYPTIITEHVVKELDKKDLWLQYKFLLQKAVYKKARLIIAVSQNLKHILEEKYGLKDKVVFIPHGIDTGVFKPRGLSETLIAKKNRMLHGYKFLCYSCGIQGVDSSAFIETVKQFPQILFIVTGRKEDIRSTNVINTGDITEEKLIEYYLLADFCFKPLKFATANNAILEAMAMGKVTITNRIAGVTDYLDDSCAYLATSVSDFPKLFEQAMNDPRDVERKGRKAREKAVREFSWEVIAPKIVKVYKQVLKNTI